MVIYNMVIYKNMVIYNMVIYKNMVIYNDMVIYKNSINEGNDDYIEFSLCA